MQGHEAAKRVADHRGTLDPQGIVECADEVCGEGRRVIGGPGTAVEAGQVYGIDEVITRQGG